MAPWPLGDQGLSLSFMQMDPWIAPLLHVNRPLTKDRPSLWDHFYSQLNIFQNHPMDKKKNIPEWTNLFKLII